MKIKIIGLLSSVLLLSSCVSNVQIVKRMESRDLPCNTSDVVVADLGSSSPGISYYEATGCGHTHRYVCGKWENIVLASVGLINLDPRPCTRVRR